MESHSKFKGAVLGIAVIIIVATAQAQISCGHSCASDAVPWGKIDDF